MKSLILLVLFLSFNVFAKAKWDQYYNLVNKDIKTVEALKTRDLGLRVRLFELYGEKLTLLLEKENEIRIKYLESGNKKQLNKMLSLQRQTLSKLESIARKIERQTKKKQVLTKINYYRSLNYYLIKKYKKFYFHIKKAEKTNRDKKLGYLINSKLADYHYNENQFKQASTYYKKLLYDKKNGWITKYYYNLAWSELKLSRFKSALDNLKRAHSYERKKGYFKIGDQLTDALLLFHAYANKTQQGISYVEANKLGSFDNYIKYLHYVFEHGNRVSTKYVIARIEKLKKNSDMEFKFLEKKVVVYRALKSFSLIQSNFALFKRRLKKLNQRSVKKETRSELKNSILSYTGYLQELVKSKRLISKKTKNRYVRYVAYNFNVLRSIDRKNALEYSYFEGETYFSLRNYKRASYVYASGLKNYIKRKQKGSKYVSKSFDSLFKALEKQKKPSTKILLFAFNSYLKLYPRGPKAQLVHQRLINFYQAKGDTKGMLSALRKYNKAYPKDIKIQRNYYRSVLDRYVGKKDVKSLGSLKKLVDKGFLKFPKAESAKIATVITQIYFSKYEGMAAKGKADDALKGFHEIYKDEKVGYEQRVEALRKEMYYLHNLFRYKELAPLIIESMKFYNKKFKKEYAKETLFYTENLCVGDLLSECILLTEAIQKDKQLKISKALRNLFFKIYSSKTENIDKAFKLATNSEKKNYLFKILLAKDPKFQHKLYPKFYSIRSMRGIIDAEIERKFLNSYYNDLSFKAFNNFIDDISISSLKSQYRSRIQSIQKVYKSSSFKFTKTPNPQDIKAEAFGQFGMKFNQDMTAIINGISNGVSRIDPNFLPMYLTMVVNTFERETRSFKKFIPISKDEQLETAMNDELAKLHQFLDQKIIEYRTLYFKAVEKTVNTSGARKYFDEIMNQKIKFRLSNVSLWEN